MQVRSWEKYLFGADPSYRVLTCTSYAKFCAVVWLPVTVIGILIILAAALPVPLPGWVGIPVGLLVFELGFALKLAQWYFERIVKDSS